MRQSAWWKAWTVTVTFPQAKRNVRRTGTGFDLAAARRQAARERLRYEYSLTGMDTILTATATSETDPAQERTDRRCGVGAVGLFALVLIVAAVAAGLLVVELTRLAITVLA